MTWTGTFWSSWAWLLLASASLLLGTSQWASAADLSPPPTLSGCLHFIRADTDMEAAAVGSAVYWELRPVDLIVRVISRRENKTWDANAESAAGAVGLAQIKPGTVCQYVWGCSSDDKTRLGKLALALRNPHINLCWSGRILATLLSRCSAAGIGCAVSSYYAGSVAAGYASDVLGD